MKNHRFPAKLLLLLIAVAVVVALGVRMLDDGEPKQRNPGFPGTAQDPETGIVEPVEVVEVTDVQLEAIEAVSRFPVGRSVDEVWLQSRDGRSIEWRRLVELDEETGRVARAVERFERDQSSGGWRLVGCEVMAPDSIVVVVPAGQTAAEFTDVLRSAGFEPRPGSPADAVVAVILPEATLEAVPAALERIGRALPEVNAEPNFLYFPSQNLPSDYDAASLWGLENIEAPVAWTVGTGSEDVVVAVLDTGIDRNHPDLAANLWVNELETPGNGSDEDANGFADDVNGWSFVEDSGQLQDPDGHGTHVSGTIGARGNNGTGVVGVNWNVRIMMLRVGNRIFESANTLNALTYVNDMKVRGVNIVAVNGSFGGESASSAFRNQLDRAQDLGILFVAAAGNESSDNDSLPVYPASYSADNVIAVASINPANELSDFSNYGATRVDIAAPGTAVRSSVPNEGYDYFDGTSMAAPHVAGAVALVAAVEPGLSWSQIKARLMQTVTPEPALAGRVVSGGRLNLRRAVAPELLRPFVEISEPAASVAVLEDVDFDLELGARLLPDGQSIASATLTWEMESGPAPVTFSNTAGGATTASFSTPGLYRLQVRAISGAIAETDEISVAVADSQLPTDGLEAWWRFDGLGNVAVDSSGRNRSGTLSGPTREAGAFGNAMVFDGFNDHVRFTPPNLSSMTISAWVRADTRGNSIFPRVVHMQSGLLFFGLGERGIDLDGNRMNLKFALDDGSEDRVWFTPPGTIETNRWYHVAMTFQQAGIHPTPKLYIDGVAYTVSTQTGGGGTPTVAVGEGYIGDNGDATRAWDGPLDEVRIYSRVLSEGEIAFKAAEAAMRSILDGNVQVQPTGIDGDFDLTFSRASTGVPAGSLVSVEWSADETPVWFSAPNDSTTQVRFLEEGSHVLRLDLLTSTGVHVARRVPVTVAFDPIESDGLYSGTADDESRVIFSAGLGDQAVLLAKIGDTVLRRNVELAANGTFALAEDGVDVMGRVNGSGEIDVVIGGLPFSGMKVSSPSGGVDQSHDGVYDGWLLDTGTRASAIVDNGVLAILIQDPGLGLLAFDSIDDEAGFSLVQDGASVVGSAGDGRLDGTFAAAGQNGRTFVLLRENTDPPRRLANLSVRAISRQGTGVLIAGFVVAGEGTVPVLVRGVGPGLVDFGIDFPLSDPVLELRSTGAGLIAQNQGWDADPPNSDIRTATARAGAFPLADGSGDSAIARDLGAGAFTAEVRGAGGGSGLVLAEAYDSNPAIGDVSLVNLSARGEIDSGDNILIGGFVVQGDAPALVLIRAIGPTLADFGVPSPVAQPQLKVLRGQEVIVEAVAWGSGENADLIAEAAVAVGAFQLDPESLDAAVLLFLEPGQYTAQVRSGDGTVGVALVEVYGVPGL